MEQHIGHRTYYENLRRFVDADPQIKASWVEITYHDQASVWARLPGLPNGLRGTLVGRQQVRRALRQSDHDVAVFNTQVPAALAAGMIRKRPYILSTDITPLQYDRMSDHYGHKADSGGYWSRYKHGVNTWLFQGAACVLPWSSWTSASLEKEYGVNNGRIEVIPPGVDLEKWQPESKRENGPLRILFVGGDFYRKGGEMLLQALEQLPAGSAELHLVTRTPLEERPCITTYYDMKPNSAELMALYQSADIFVLPTSAEAFGIAAVEAAATGLPVIATRVGGLVDIVIEGETGFLIPEGDTAALAARLNHLLSNAPIRQQMGRAARAHVEANFDARQNAGRLVEIVRNAMKQS